MDIAGIINSVKGKVGTAWNTVSDLLDTTHLPEQIRDVDFGGLFTNPWFLVPFIALVGYFLWKQAFRDLIIMALLLGVWYASGTTYMQTLVIGDELQVKKVLPVMFGGAVVLGAIIYLLFGRSD